MRFHPEESANDVEESSVVRALKEIRLRTAKRQIKEEVIRCWREELAFPNGFVYSREGDGWGGCIPQPVCDPEPQG